MSQLTQAYQTQEKNQDSKKEEGKFLKIASSWLDLELKKIRSNPNPEEEALVTAEKVGYSLLQFLEENGLLKLDQINFKDSPFNFLNTEKILDCWKKAKEKRDCCWRNLDLESAGLDDQYDWEKVNAPTDLVANLQWVLVEAAKGNYTFEKKAFPSEEINSILISKDRHDTSGVDFKRSIAEIAEEEQELQKQKTLQLLFDACTVNYSSLRKREDTYCWFSGSLKDSLVELWTLGCRLEDLAGKDRAFAEELEAEAKKISEGKKGKCDSCTDYLLLGAAEFVVISEKKQRYEAYNSCGVHLGEFEDEDPYTLASHSFQQYKDDGSLRYISDPCEIFCDAPEQEYAEEEGFESFPLVSFCWYRDDSKQRKINSECEELFNRFFSKRLDGKVPVKSPNETLIKKRLEELSTEDSLTRADKAKAACLLLGL